MLQRFTLIIRLRWNPAGQNWCGEIEMVNPHRVATFRNHCELWNLLNEWTKQSNLEMPLTGEEDAD